MSRKVRLTQTVLSFIALALVATLFLSGMAGGRSMDVPASSNSPGPVTPSPVDEGQRMPGVPDVPAAEHETFPAETTLNPDRLVDFEPDTGPLVEFEEGLGGLAEYAEQVVDWQLCDDESGAQCTTILAPLDWDAPGGDAVEIAVRRITDGDSSMGPLFVNPGGPGFGGQDFAERLAGRWANYDTVGWDPRGTGQSTSVVCGTFDQTDEFMDLDASPDDDAEDLALRDGSVAFAEQCRESSGALLDHISTVDVVRDLDLLRHLLGADELNYVGVSYGTYVGAMYAELFPDTTGRLVLDAAVDITGEDTIPQSAGFELALGNFTAWCAGSELCALGDDRDVIGQAIADLLSGLDADPIPVGERLLTQTLATTGVAIYLYEDEQAYRSLAEVLGRAMAGDGEALLYSADLMNGRGAGSYDTIAYAFPAMVCADAADEGMDVVPDDWRDTFDDAPIMAPNLGMSYTCQVWTAEPAPQIRITAAGAPTILVVGTTGDSATPYEQAVSMADQLESGVLLTYDGAGHGAVSGDNSCIAAAVDAYLLDGDAPDAGTTCS